MDIISLADIQKKARGLLGNGVAAIPLLNTLDSAVRVQQKARGLLGDNVTMIPVLGALDSAVRVPGMIKQGDYAGATEAVTNMVPVSKIAAKVIKQGTRGLSDGDIGAVLNIKKPDYQGHHQAVVDGFGAPLNDMTRNVYPKDFYGPKGLRIYGAGQAGDDKAHAIAQRVRNKPDAPVTMYRAVPKGKQSEINAGDWVTTTKEYAQIHGDSVLDGKYDIITKKVPAKHLITQGDSIQEYGYNPDSLGIQGGTGSGLLDININRLLGLLNEEGQQ